MAAAFDGPDQNLVQHRRGQTQRELRQPGVQHDTQLPQVHGLVAQGVSQVFDERDRVPPYLPVFFCGVEVAVIVGLRRPFGELVGHSQPVERLG